MTDRFSPLEAWFRGADVAPRPDTPLDAVARRGDAGFGIPVPRAAPAVYVATFRDAVHAAMHTGRAVLRHLDPTVAALIIPSAYDTGGAGQRALGSDVDAALADLFASGADRASLTWSTLRQVEPPYEPRIDTWAPDIQRSLTADCGVVFFADLDALVHHAHGLITRAGLDAHATHGPELRIDARGYRVQVDLRAWLVEALWTGAGPAAVLARRTAELPRLMRTLHATRLALARRFPHVAWAPDGVWLTGRTADDTVRVDGRALIDAATADGLGMDAYLARVSLSDLAQPLFAATILIRSPAYQRARPDALAEVREGALWVAMREQDGRVTPVPRETPPRAGRWAHHLGCAMRHLHARQFTAHAFVYVDAFGTEHSDCIAVVGHDAASLLLDTRLPQAVFGALGPMRDTLQAAAVSERVVLIGSQDVSRGVWDTMRTRAIELAQAVFGDQGDPLDVHVAFTTTDAVTGRFELSMVPGDYFRLRDRAARYSAAGVDKARAAYLRGIAAELIGTLDAAATHHERALRLDPSAGEYAHVLGRVLSKQGDTERALALLQRASAKLPDSAEVANALGIVLGKLGRFQGAVAALEKAVVLAPDDVTYMVNAGKAQASAGAFDDAVRTLKRALELDESVTGVHAMLATLLHKRGARTEALAHVREALAEAPNNEDMRRLLAALWRPEP